MLLDDARYINYQASTVIWLNYHQVIMQQIIRTLPSMLDVQNILIVYSQTLIRLPLKFKLF